MKYKNDIGKGRSLRIAVGLTVLALMMTGGAGATKFIRNDATGGDCNSFGTWNAATMTCTMTADLIETIQIDSNDTTLDGDGYQTAGSGTGYGVNLTGRSGVTIKNLNVGQFANGFYLLNSNNNYLIGNKASSNDNGIYLSGSSSNTLNGNNANTNAINGIYLDHYSSSNTLSGNNANSNTGMGIHLNHYSDNNTLSSNNANLNNGNGIGLASSKINNLTGNNANSNRGSGGIYLTQSSSNKLSDNNVNLNNFGIVLNSGSSSNRLSGNNANSNNQIGIHLLNSCDTNTLNGNYFSNNKNGGIRLQTDSNTLSGNTAISNSVYGIYVSGSSNYIFNNFFNNSINLVLFNAGGNTWNTVEIPGTNIIGGPYLGGNFWAYPNGTGYSQTCPDADKDGICNAQYTLDSNNIDYLPLTYNLASMPIQVTNPGSISNIILNDNGRARPPGTNITRLNVTVTGNVSTVTINLSTIGGSSGTPMTRIPGTDIYTITTNATSCNNFPTSLLVNATDTSGNFNNSVGIPLYVLLPGDVNFDCRIDLKDLLFMRRYLAGLEPWI